MVETHTKDQRGACDDLIPTYGERDSWFPDENQVRNERSEFTRACAHGSADE